MAELLRIGEAARTLGTTPKALRFYERKGILPAVRRNGARYRLYSPEDLDRARFLLRAKAMGLALEEARELLACAEAGCCGETGPQMAGLLREKLGEIDTHMRDLRALRAKLTQALESVEGCGDRNPKATSCEEEICLPRRREG